MKMNSVLNQNNVKANFTFTGAREGKQFRRIANKLVFEFKKVPIGDFHYYCTSKAKPQSLRERLSNAVFNKPREIGESFITNEDKRLHENLKDLYKKHEEQYDYTDVMMGGGGRFVDHTVDYTI